MEDLQQYEQHSRSDQDHIKWLRIELDQRDAEMQARCFLAQRKIARRFNPN